MAKKLTIEDAPALVIDTREPPDTRYQFEHPTVVTKLDTGDYSIVGLEGCVAVERKELGDFIGCVGNSRDRFSRELARSNGMRRLWVVIEATLSDIAVGNYRSQINTSAVLGSIAAWENRFDSARFVFAGSRSLGQHFTFRLLTRAWLDDIQGVL